MFKQKFGSLIWLTYRKNFKPLLADDLKLVETFLSIRPHMVADKKRVARVGSTSDVGWGCAIRVCQMLFSHTILRHTLGETYSQVCMTNIGMREKLKVL